MNKRRVIKKAVKAAIHPRRTVRGVRLITTRLRHNRRRQAGYKQWFAQYYTALDQDRARQIEQSGQFALRPTISIIVPVYDTPEKFLRACIESVQQQSYPHWELCLVDDASPSDVLTIIKQYAAQDDRIKYRRTEVNQHISGTSKTALQLATGEFIALLDHDDLLLPNALYEVVSLLNQHPDADLIYSDEDKVDEQDTHMEPFFKPDWSPDFLNSCNYITHFSVFRARLLRQIDDFRLGTEGAQDWDLLLRFTSLTQNIYHVPKILYSWRKLPTSTAVDPDSKPYAYINQLKVLRDSLYGSPIAVSVYEHIFLGFWRVRYQIQDNPLVSIIIPTKNNYEFIQRSVRSIIEKSTYSNFEIIIVDTGSTDQAVHDFYRSKLIAHNRVKVLHWSRPFNFSAVCNYGAATAKGDYFVFLNDDTKVLSADWLEGLLEHAQRPEIGMVGCKLLFPDGMIQHAGVVLSDRDVAYHPFYHQDPLLDIFINIYANNIRNCAAVTAACCMVNRTKFEEVGGFDEELKVTFNDIDLNLKLLARGYRNLYTPFVELLHYESISVGRITGEQRDQKEIKTAAKIMHDRWGHYLKRDPYYNDNFMQHGPGYDF